MSARLPWTWGDPGRTTAPAAPRGYEGAHLVRAVRVAAPPEVTFRWLTQLKVAPYSYDVIDNAGRRSPRTLTDGLTVEPGETLVTIFTVTRLCPGRLLELTLTEARALRAFGPLVCTYQSAPDPDVPSGSILRCDLFLAPTTRLGAVRTSLLAWGDLVMMRKQLLTFKTLSERDGRAARTSDRAAGTR